MSKTIPQDSQKPASMPRSLRVLIGIFILFSTVGMLSCQAAFVALWR
jgi:hypothetical protein